VISPQPMMPRRMIGRLCSLLVVVPLRDIAAGGVVGLDVYSSVAKDGVGFVEGRNEQDSTMRKKLSFDVVSIIP
jgi:hypothetical protein